MIGFQHWGIKLLIICLQKREKWNEHAFLMESNGYIYGSLAVKINLSDMDNHGQRALNLVGIISLTNLGFEWWKLNIMISQSEL